MEDVQGEEGDPGMALPIRKLLLSSSANNKLEAHLWTDRYIQSRIQADGRVYPAQIRYRGGHTRDYPKRSYDVRYNGRTYHYNAEYDDPSMIRNALSFAVLPKLGVHAPRCRHIQLYRNGRYQGVYLEIESVGKGFFQRRMLTASSLFYAVNNNANYSLRDAETDRMKSSLLTGYEHKFGGPKEKSRLAAFIRGIHSKDAKQVQAALVRHLDIDQYLRWLSGAVLTGNYDGFEQNYAVYRHGKSGKLRHIPWDYEGTWGRNCYGQIQNDQLVPIWGYNTLTDTLLSYSRWRERYANILRQALDGPFQEQGIMPVARRMMENIAPYVRQDPFRRGSFDQFLQEPALIRRFIRVRRESIKRELATK